MRQSQATTDSCQCPCFRYSQPTNSTDMLHLWGCFLP